MVTLYQKILKMLVFPRIRSFSHRPPHNTICMLPDGLTTMPSFLFLDSFQNNTFLLLWWFHLLKHYLDQLFSLSQQHIYELVQRCILVNYFTVLVGNHVIWKKEFTNNVALALTGLLLFWNLSNSFFQFIAKQTARLAVCFNANFISEHLSLPVVLISDALLI